MVPDCGDKRDVKALAYTTAYASPNFFVEFFVSNGGSKSDLFLLNTSENVFLDIAQYERRIFFLNYYMRIYLKLEQHTSTKLMYVTSKYIN